MDAPKNGIYLIDGSSFLYRSYYALTPLTTSDGTPVQATYGFIRMIYKLITERQPHYIGLVWDSRLTTVRKQKYQTYKAQREKAPHDLFEQKQQIQRFAEAIGLHQETHAHEEADDVMASIAHRCASTEQPAIFVTTDKDMRQIVSDKIVILDPFKNRLCDRAYYEERYGFALKKLPFYFALVGDTSDNIPGVRGVGPKTATKLVQAYNSLDDLYHAIAQGTAQDVTQRIQDKLTTHQDDAYTSRELFTLHDVPIETTLDDLAFDPDQFWNATPLFEELEFSSLVHKAPADKRPATVNEVGFARKYGYQFTCVTTQKELDRVCAEIAACSLCACDTETDSTNPHTAQLVGISVCCAPRTAYYIPVDHTTDEPHLDKTTVIQALKPLLQDTQRAWIFHNAKYDMHVLAHAGIEEAHCAFDTQLAAHLVRERESTTTLKGLSQAYLKETMRTYTDVVTRQKYTSFAEVPLATACDYAAADAHQTLQLYHVLYRELEKRDLLELYTNIEHPLIKILYQMERIGIAIETHVLDTLGAHIDREIAATQDKIHDYIGPGQTYNLNSPAQVGTLLFHDLGLPSVGTTKTGYATNQEVLEKLAKLHEVPRLLLRYRELHKLKTTYIAGLRKAIHPETGRIHTTYKQAAVETGRLSSANPNLQNIPSQPIYDTTTIRSAFVADEGRTFLSADYSQIELRILAYLSQDATLQQAFENKEDIHTTTATQLFDVAHHDVTPHQRQIAKRINFSIIYGLTPYGLSQDLGIPIGTAHEYIATYMGQYPQVKTWMEHVVATTQKHGYVTTLYGRRRYLPEINAENTTQFQAARRAAINTRVQGTAAEIMKKGMLAFHNAKKAEQVDAHILLQIHDELIVSTSTACQKATTSLLKTHLENVVTWDIPLEVEIAQGPTWQAVSK